MSLKAAAPRRLFHYIRVSLSPVEIGRLLIGAQCYLDLDRKTVLEDGLVIYKEATSGMFWMQDQYALYTINGSGSIYAYYDQGYIRYVLPVELVAFAKKLDQLKIDFELIHPDTQYSGKLYVTKVPFRELSGVLQRGIKQKIYEEDHEAFQKEEQS